VVAAGSRRRRGSARVLATVALNQVTVVDLATADWQRIVELIEVYADLRLDVVDASTMAAAERLGQTTIATLDQRELQDGAGGARRGFSARSRSELDLRASASLTKPLLEGDHP
jgi:predicted nucleic acid-binding protein